MQPIYLASGSPRRAELLTQLGVPFSRLATEVIEQAEEGESPRVYTTRLSQEKARAGLVVAPEPRPVLGADTIVVFENQILEKPQSPAHAYEILSRLSGRTHQVLTAVTIIDAQLSKTICVETAVTFCSMTSQQINHYIDTQEPDWIKRVLMGSKVWEGILFVILRGVTLRWSDCH